MTRDLSDTHKDNNYSDMQLDYRLKSTGDNFLMTKACDLAFYFKVNTGFRGTLPPFRPSCIKIMPQLSGTAHSSAI